MRTAEEVVHEIHSALGDGDKQGLRKTAALLEALQAWPACPVIHVAGTNGKGSVCHILASILSAAGLRTGLYTSPHLIDFRERIRVFSGQGAECGRRVMPSEGVSTPGHGQGEGPVGCKLSLAMTQQTMGGAGASFSLRSPEKANSSKEKGEKP